MSKSRVLSFRVTKAQMAFLKQQSELTGESVSGVVRLLIEKDMRRRSLQ